MRMPTTLPSSVTTTEPVSACCIARAACGQGVVGGARHRGGGHEIAHDGFHGSHYDALSLRL